MNPKKWTQLEYDNFVQNYRSNEYSFIIDWVHDVERQEIKEISPIKFDEILRRQ